MLLPDISDYLTSGGVTASIYLGKEPPDPPTCLVLYEIPGRAAPHGMTNLAGQAAVEQPGLRVVSRSDSYATARLNADAAWKLLDGLPTRVINNCQYHWGMARESPYGIGRDEQDRPHLACNYDVIKALSTG